MKFIAFYCSVILFSIISLIFCNQYQKMTLPSNSIFANNSKSLKSSTFLPQNMPRGCLSNKSYGQCLLDKGCYWDLETNQCLIDKCPQGSQGSCCSSINNKLECNLSRSCFYNKTAKKCSQSTCKSYYSFRDISLWIKAHPLYEKRKSYAFKKYNPKCNGNNCKYYEPIDNKCPSKCINWELRGNRACIERDAFYHLKSRYGGWTVIYLRKNKK